MSGPASVDIPVYHGDTLTFSVVISEDVDLTGHTALLQVRDKGTLVAEWSPYVTVSGQKQIDIVVPGAPDAEGTLSLPRPARVKNFDYDLQLTSPTGTVRTILRGQVICTGDVSYG